jgi:hypothetical protein
LAEIPEDRGKTQKIYAEQRGIAMKKGRYYREAVVWLRPVSVNSETKLQVEALYGSEIGLFYVGNFDRPYVGLSSDVGLRY